MKEKNKVVIPPLNLGTKKAHRAHQKTADFDYEKQIYSARNTKVNSIGNTIISESILIRIY